MPNDVLAIEPRSLGSTNKELGPIGVGTSIGHAEDARASVLELEILVLELVPVDGLAAGAVVVGEVPTLAHEVGDHAVEGGTPVPESFLSSAKSAEVLRRLWDNIGSQLK